jgi:PDZ domain/Tetratricopeptide repeat
MRSRCCLARAMGTVLLVLLVLPAMADDRDGCSFSTDSKEKRIEVCSRLIASGRLSGKELAKAYYVRGATFDAMDNHDRSIADFSEVIRIDPNGPDAYQKRGEAYRNMKEYDRAIADFSTAIRLAPNDDFHLFYRASLYCWDKQDYERAIADMSEAIRIKPGSAFNFRFRGEIYEKKGDRDKALADFRSALAIDPNEKNAKEGLARWSGVAWFGVSVQEVTEEIADAFDIKPPRGAFVSAVNERGPAKPAGIEPHDVIVGFDEEDVATAADLPRLVAARPIGKEVRVTLIRGGLTKQEYVTLARREDAGQPVAPPPPAERTPAPPPAAQAQPPAPRIATAPVPATVKGLFEKYGLIGAFAADCSQPVSAQNVYIVYRANGDYVQRDDMSGGTASDASVIDAAAEAAPNQLGLSMANARGRVNLVLRIEAGRWRLLESTRDDGAKLVSGGRATQGAREQSPWLNKCGG